MADSTPEKSMLVPSALYTERVSKIGFGAAEIQFLKYIRCKVSFHTIKSCLLIAFLHDDAL